MIGPFAYADGVKDSTPVDHIYARLVWFRDGGILPSESKIAYDFLSTDVARRVFYPRKEYFCRMQLFDSKGETVLLREAARDLGSRFSELTDYSTDALDRRVGGSNHGTPRFQEVRPDNGPPTLKALPASEEAFRMTNTGRYTLRCEFQVFEQLRSGSNFTYKLIRLPPIDVPVVKAAKEVVLPKTNDLPSLPERPRGPRISQ